MSLARPRARTLQRLSIALFVTLLSGVIGRLVARFSDDAALWSRTATSALVGLGLTLLEMTLQAPRGAAVLRRFPVLPVFLLRILLYGMVFVLVEAVIRTVRYGASAAFEGIMTDQVTRGDALTVVGLSVGFNALFILRGLLGPGTLLALSTGRYHRPLQERRIVLFMDVAGSTRIAEQIGDLAFHGFLNQVFFDMTDPVLDSGGEIYRYVGDEVIVTWPFARGVRGAACVRCVFAIASRLAARRAEYERQYGAAPRLRSALHAGNLVIGEMGEFKREIVMLGDTMNTAARIEEVCRTSGHDVIAAGEVIHALTTLPEGVSAENLGLVQLRGKAAALELFALARDGRE